MKRMFLLAAALCAVAALAGCHSPTPDTDVRRPEIPAGSATVRAGLLHAKQQQQKQQQPLTNFQTRCQRMNDTTHCQTSN
ncbi:hypothetical protein ATY81_12325 [Rhizobium sp. R72]|uniref:hypothetical protein n=1 Tax=unclassified Rhizobium TaxID=2613769 RepID=UPI000B52C325|nr:MULTISPECIES: hypothetical protein [unclassified Rhizobium]OWV94231.1 hypothetical protein ATY81_12325 [Rhizobium sp. R72]OWV94501.1 hypothetical protein ATY80_12325 [Rhizobium sp. R711]OWV99054.1 hypothetical protein ATY79_17810 [Rhizobium sp. R693]